MPYYSVCEDCGDIAGPFTSRDEAAEIAEDHSKTAFHFGHHGHKSRVRITGSDRPEAAST